MASRAACAVLAIVLGVRCGLEPGRSRRVAVDRRACNARRLARLADRLRPPFELRELPAPGVPFQPLREAIVHGSHVAPRRRGSLLLGLRGRQGRHCLTQLGVERGAVAAQRLLRVTRALQVVPQASPFLVGRAQAFELGGPGVQAIRHPLQGPIERIQPIETMLRFSQLHFRPPHPVLGTRPVALTTQPRQAIDLLRLLARLGLGRGKLGLERGQHVTSLLQLLPLAPGLGPEPGALRPRVLKDPVDLLATRHSTQLAGDGRPEPLAPDRQGVLLGLPGQGEGRPLVEPEQAGEAQLLRAQLGPVPLAPPGAQEVAQPVLGLVAAPAPARPLELGRGPLHELLANPPILPAQLEGDLHLGRAAAVRQHRRAGRTADGVKLEQGRLQRREDGRLAFLVVAGDQVEAVDEPVQEHEPVQFAELADREPAQPQESSRTAP